MSLILVTICLYDVAYVYNYHVLWIAYIEKLCVVVSMCGLMLIGAFNYRKIADQETAVKIFFVLLFLISIISLLDIGGEYTKNNIITYFTNKNAMPLYFMPMAFFIGLSVKSFDVVKKTVLVCLLLSYSFFFFYQIAYGGLVMQQYYAHIGVSFLALFSLSKKYLLIKRFAFVLLLTSGYIHFMNDNRAQFLLVLAIITLFIVSVAKYDLIKRIVVIYAFIVIVLFFYDSLDINSIMSAGFFRDSRSWIYDEFFNDLSLEEVLTGRGPMGYSYSSYFRKVVDGDFYNRFAVESGFLTIILKAGAVYLLLVLLISISSIYKGFLDGVRGWVVNSFYIIVFIAFQFIVSFFGYGIMPFIFWYVVGSNMRVLDDDA
ncbi:hypothetical protein [Prosthecochloris sp. SCSIO W1103]|uniref:hypothetical protein n=1 Tax=Prosthecochloris sp. SCSIO W1103 TaxID=2992244 RepID=UPI00223C9842|nr:hypothetical protein [Prosthecochloris sp. SCSIO W1103]UZJ38142.1 hypothetical protein OO005_02760 [Prosthecochloris sp. SCSIO W1103]